MNNFLNTILFQSGKTIEGEYKKAILLVMNDLKGVENQVLFSNSVELEYYPQLQTPDTLKKALEKASFVFVEETERSHSILNHFVSYLGKENQKEFGSKAPSCCG